MVGMSTRYRAAGMGYAVFYNMNRKHSTTFITFSESRRQVKYSRQKQKQDPAATNSTMATMTTARRLPARCC